jgi:hypothetical protein
LTPWEGQRRGRGRRKLIVYSDRVDLARLRGRIPLIAFVLLAVVCLALFGFACACLSDQPGQAIERATSFGTTLPPLVAVWALLIASIGGASFVLVAGERTRSRASPALLQRFLF